MPYFEGAEGTTLNNSTLWDIAGSATFNEFKIIFVNHIAGITPIPDLRESVQKRALHDSIRALPRANAAYNDYTPSDKRRVICLEGTRHALLREIAEWITAEDQPQIYVLFGPAGFGKSTIAQTIAERADELLYLGASFFFSRDEVKRRTAERLFTTIAFQLCGYDKEFARAIGAILETEKGSSATSKTPLEQLNTLILDPLKDIIKLRSWPMVIVIDALDECDDADVLAVLDALNRLVQQFPSFKIFLTTRPNPHLASLLNDPNQNGNKVFQLQSIEDKIVEGDISLFLKHKLSLEQVNACLPSLRKPWSASEQDIEALVQAAGRLFIFASTAVRFILDKVEYNPASRMNILRIRGRLSLDGLESFYIVILRRAVPRNSNRKVIERFQVVIGTILVLPKPLPIKALEYFTYPWSSDDIDAVLKNLQSVITVDNDTPRIYHKSFSDFITDPERCQDDNLCIIPKDQHTRMAIRCLRVMNSHLKRNILDLDGHIQYMDNDDALASEMELKDRLQEKIPPELRYACTSWVHHLVGGNNEDADIMVEVERFVKDHLLHWFEVLSWINALESAHRDLIALLKLTKLPSQRELFFDGLRLISRSYETVRKSALHVYHSALLFTPTESLLYKERSKDTGLCKVVGGPTRWHGAIASWYHDRDRGCFRQVVFSKDSTQLASFRKRIAHLWDGTSGTPLRLFKGDMHTISADFSQVAIGQDNVVTLHNATNGVRGATLHHPLKVIGLALSYDGARLAVGLSDRTVRVWDGGRHDHVATFEGYSDTHRQLEFSPNDYTLAFASADGTVYLRNGENGEFIGNLDYPIESQSNFVFSQDGSRLASIIGTQEGSCLALWNGGSGLIGMTRSPRHVFAISPDGSLLATAARQVQLWSGRHGNPLPLVDTLHVSMSVDSLAFSGHTLAVGSSYSIGIVKLYDLTTCALVATIRTFSLGSLAFSPDGSRLIAAERTSGRMALWDVPGLISPASNSKHRSRRITALAISPDCLRLASGNKDGTVELWDIAHTGKQLATYKDHSEDITVLVFCSAGERLASGSRDTTVRLWNGRDGTPIDSLSHAFRFLISMTFSSCMLAIAAADGITLWDSSTLDRLHLFELSSYQLSLSLDDSLLASASKTYSGSQVELWCVESRTRVDALQFNEDVARIMFSPDGTLLAVQLRTGILELFKVVGNQIIAIRGNKDVNLSWLPVPQWNGFAISLGSQNEAHLLLGRSPDCDHPVPILRIPGDAAAFSSYIPPQLLTFSRYLCKNKM